MYRISLLLTMIIIVLLNFANASHSCLPNIQAMINLYASDANYFWHENDKYTITSKGHIWCFPNQPAPSISVEKTVDDLYANDMSFFRKMTNRLTVGVLPEINKTDIYQYNAICTDNIIKYETELKKDYDKTGTI